MLKKVISLTNIGRFRNSAYTPNPEWAKHTVVYAANGSGKSTLTCILRSLKLQDPDLIAGRRRLSSVEPPRANLLFDDGTKQFLNGTWTAEAQNVLIFDSVFVSENVHAGDVVDVQNRRKLYRIIVGDTGLGLAQREQELTESARQKQNEISELERRIGQSIPNGLSKEAFIGMAEDSEIDQKIEKQQQKIKGLEQGDTLRAKAALVTLNPVVIGIDYESILGKTLDGGSREQSEVVSTHCEKHGLSGQKQNWIAQGMEFVTEDACGFCGRSGLDELDLYRAFKTIFGQEYRQLQGEVTDTRRRVENVIGANTRSQIETAVARNGAAFEFWKQYCNIEDIPGGQPITEALAEAARCLADAFDRKERMLLDAISRDDTSLSTGITQLEIAGNLVLAYDAAVGKANEIIAQTKAQMEAGNLTDERQILAILRATKIRHEGNVAADCNALERIIGEKKVMEEEKGRVREQLEAHCLGVVTPYEGRINYFLERFNAGFRIGATGYSYAGGIASSQYQLVVDTVNVDLGDGRTPDGQPSFRNTLSAGDRTTLALAFFLASLEADPDLANKVVVFDDPFSSQDSFRQSNTVFEIMKVAERCKQVVVLSHDSRFLRLIWSKCPNNERVALQISNHSERGSQIMEFAIEDANVGRAQQDLDDLLAYRATGSGVPRDIIRKLRVVLETHFRTTYPNSFNPNDNCGEILRKIREGGDTHPAKTDYEALERINDYTATYHHGENPAGATEPDIDNTELNGFVNDTLRIVNALPV